MPQPQTFPVSYRKLLAIALVATSIVAVSGCATSKDKLMPHGSQTMDDLWHQGVSGDITGNTTGGMGQDALVQARTTLRRPISDGQMVGQERQYTRTAQNEIYSQFTRLPNPDMVMYVYPHLTWTENAPVPGYSTVFPLYTKPVYAMPGEGESARPVGRTR